MNRHFKRIFIVAAMAVMMIAGTTKKSTAQDISVSYQMFYDNLAPYGQWIYDPDYGNVWVPNEGGDFRPYGSRGYWVMTDYGNTWVSDDPWGWAVYHYGRWTFNPYYGWVWIPGYEWAPAWVTWRFGGGYCGWAPLGPGVQVGMSYYAPDSWWIFMGPNYMYQRNCIRYWWGPQYNVNYIHRTTIINNYYMDNNTRVRYNYGPRAEVIQQVTGRPVQVYRVSQMNRPGAPGVGRNTVSIYRPNVDRVTINNSRPSQVMQAPRPVGRGQGAAEYGSDRQPEFRQQMTRQQPDSRGGVRQGGEPGRFDNRQDGRGQVDQNNRFNDRTPQNDNRPQPGRFDNRNDQPDGRFNDRTPQNDNRPQPGRFDDRNVQPGGRINDRAPQNDSRPQPGRFDNAPQPNRNETRPEPSRFDNSRQNYQPQPQPTPQVQPQPQRDMNQDRGNRFEDRRDDRRSMQPSRYDNRMDNRPQYQPQQPPRQETFRPSNPQPQNQPQPGGLRQQSDNNRQPSRR
jgi:hypothetical protein